MFRLYKQAFHHYFGLTLIIASYPFLKHLQNIYVNKTLNCFDHISTYKWLSSHGSNNALLGNIKHLSFSFLFLRGVGGGGGERMV